MGNTAEGELLTQLTWVNDAQQLLLVYQNNLSNMYCTYFNNVLVKSILQVNIIAMLTMTYYQWEYIFQKLLRWTTKIRTNYIAYNMLILVITKS
jgi:hypothetical protein